MTRGERRNTVSVGVFTEQSRTIFKLTPLV
jgi:hypothetical protein